MIIMTCHCLKLPASEMKPWQVMGQYGPEADSPLSPLLSSSVNKHVLQNLDVYLVFYFVTSMPGNFIYLELDFPADIVRAGFTGPWNGSRLRRLRLHAG